MKYCFKFFRGCRVLDDIDEVIIRYTHKTTELITYAETRPEKQRLIIDITELTQKEIEDSLSIFSAAKKKHKDIAMLLLDEQSSFVAFAEMNIPFFFLNAPRDYDQLSDYIRLGVSDVYITNEMGFNLNKIAPMCKKNHVNIRVYPNVTQTSSKFSINSLQEFFIRPDDISLYNDLVDIMEFWGPLDKQPVLYEIYKEERWLGDLNTIILGLSREINNMCIMPYFGRARVNCGKRCNYEGCDVCEYIFKTSETLKEKELFLVRKKASDIEQEIKMENERAEELDKI